MFNRWLEKKINGKKQEKRMRIISGQFHNWKIHSKMLPTARAWGILNPSSTIMDARSSTKRISFFLSFIREIYPPLQLRQGISCFSTSMFVWSQFTFRKCSLHPASILLALPVKDELDVPFRFVPVYFHGCYPRKLWSHSKFCTTGKYRIIDQDSNLWCGSI